MLRLLAVVGPIAAGLMACSTVPIEHMAAPAPIAAADGASRSIRLQKITTEIPPETEVGTWCHASCMFRVGLRFAAARRVLAVQDLAAAFAAEMKQAHYTVIGDPNTLLDDTRADLLVAAVIKDLKANLHNGNGLGVGFDHLSGGEVSLRVDWVIFDPATGRVVREIEAAGYGKEPGSKDGGDRRAGALAFGEATRALLGNAQFAQIAAPAATLSPPALLANLTLGREAPFSTPIEQRMSQVQAAVVAIHGGRSRDSGFIIDNTGFVLTSGGAVAGESSLTVRLADGRELAAERVAFDPKRNIALLKLASPVSVALPLATADLPISTEVLLVGVPLSAALQGTVTRGVISGYRTIDAVRYIQSDVAIQPGSLGAPMVDRAGNVVGIAVGGATTGSGAPLGVSFVVPIADAAQALGVTLSAGR
jgi:serine protease Do